MSKNHFISDINGEYRNADILSIVEVVHHEWDMDGYAALVKIDDSTCVFTTNHGGLVKMSLAEGRKFFRGQITETQKMVDAMKEFQGLIGKSLKA